MKKKISTNCTLLHLFSVFHRCQIILNRIVRMRTHQCHGKSYSINIFDTYIVYVKRVQIVISHNSWTILSCNYECFWCARRGESEIVHNPLRQNEHDVVVVDDDETSIFLTKVKPSNQNQNKNIKRKQFWLKPVLPAAITSPYRTTISISIEKQKRNIYFIHFLNDYQRWECGKNKIKKKRQRNQIT